MNLQYIFSLSRPNGVAHALAYIRCLLHVSGGFLKIQGDTSPVSDIFLTTISVVRNTSETVSALGRILRKPLEM